MSNAIARQIEATLAITQATREAIEDSVKRYEAEGRRIIDGGQEGLGWAFYDYRTKEVLASSDHGDDPDACGDGTWCHIDGITQSVWEEVGFLESAPNPCGLPDGLATVITEWVEGHEDDAREYLQKISTGESDRVSELLAHNNEQLAENRAQRQIIRNQEVQINWLFNNIPGVQNRDDSPI